MVSKATRVWYWIVTIIFAAFMLFSGIGGLIGSEAGDVVMAGLGYPLYLNTILGIAKILGAIAILQTRFRVIKEWAYAGFTFDMVGALLSFLLSGMGIGPALFIIPSLIVMFVSYWLWKKVSN